MKVNIGMYIKQLLKKMHLKNPLKNLQYKYIKKGPGKYNALAGINENGKYFISKYNDSRSRKFE